MSYSSFLCSNDSQSFLIRLLICFFNPSQRSMEWPMMFSWYSYLANYFKIFCLHKKFSLDFLSKNLYWLSLIVFSLQLSSLWFFSPPIVVRIFLLTTPLKLYHWHTLYIFYPLQEYFYLYFLFILIPSFFSPSILTLLSFH